NLVSYKTYNENGQLVPSEFRLSFIEPDVISKETRLVPSEDLDKPNELKLINNIGTIVTEEETSTILLRYSGLYEPLFKDLLMFKTKSGFEGLKTTFNLTPNFGYIDNFYYHKVSNVDIMKLAKNEKY